MGEFQLNDLLTMRADLMGELARHKAKFISTGARKHSHKSLYFVLCGDAVKIGVSADPDFRLSTLQTGAPGRLTLLAAIPNRGEDESKYHKIFDHLRIHGEWYRYTEEIAHAISQLQSESQC